jgi:hypothetical protein
VRGPAHRRRILTNDPSGRDRPAGSRWGHRRTDLNGESHRFRERQSEHARGNPWSDFSYEIVGRARPGTELDRLEEYFIRQHGDPTSMRNPFGGLANRRHQMSPDRYIQAGGDY